MKYAILAFACFLLPGAAQGQAIVPDYEFSSVAFDYTATAPNPTTSSLQGSFGQTIVTSAPPTNTNQTLAYGGFGETYVPFAYLAFVTLDSFVGNANPGVTYGKITNIPFTAETFNTSGVNEGVLSGVVFFADATGKVKVLSFMNPAFAQSLSVKGPIWLRRNAAITPPADPINGYPSAGFTLAGGDANGDNSVDVADFGALVNAYSSLVTDPISGYVPTADFNQDGSVDISDFGILVNNYSSVGDP